VEALLGFYTRHRIRKQRGDAEVAMATYLRRLGKMLRAALEQK
jgi:hypothetical protein